jgi:hypothetical protein
MRVIIPIGYPLSFKRRETEPMGINVISKLDKKIFHFLWNPETRNLAQTLLQDQQMHLVLWM